jgi:Tfp pilus assembly PilM family ATPase
MGSVAVKVLHQDVRRVRLERYAVVPVDDDRITDDDVVRTVSVP